MPESQTGDSPATKAALPRGDFARFGTVPVCLGGFRGGRDVGAELGCPLTIHPVTVLVRGGRLGNAAKQ